MLIFFHKNGDFYKNSKNENPDFDFFDENRCRDLDTFLAKNGLKIVKIVKIGKNGQK